MKTEINFIFVGELIALFRYGPISIYGKLVIELLKFIWGDSNTDFKDVDWRQKTNLNPRTAEGHICAPPPPHRFFADSRKMAARSAAKFGITVHSSFAHLV